MLGCGLAAPSSPTRPPLPTPTLALLAPSPTPPPTPTGDWQPLGEGLERRQIEVMGADGRLQEAFYILRFAPHQFRWGVGYAPGQPQTLADWQRQTGALVVVNGGYFTPEFTATGLIIVDGVARGSSYVGFGGMVGIDGEGTAVVRSLSASPYDPQEGWWSAVQSFPMLVLPGGQLGFPAEFETGQRARRTVIGQDVDGRILLILAPRGGFTLHQLSAWLVASDLQLDVALNLDGGPSTGLLLAEPSHVVPAFSALPAVLFVQRR